ncbi:hypothetical protein CBM2592_A190009 [Cupriavidus taiwanensis]|nr:hypothetical protein CBM2592_A190009 [Cupriavidus taiwanensis]SOY83032.1 hypothetical protein CBM2591_A230010 [Cupriavidus taiwanensis]SOZ56207.1 hypothetical protein CBM2617_A200017 [Cupriavidus taiwanensis]SOZ78802.1 hypothetical protein CBM2618_A180017 [Cupriavidus taiwanensis]SOZ79072.1 hypothetical protein CBM2622_A170016 [Cupriavidus taiwanensis]
MTAPHNLPERTLAAVQAASLEPTFLATIVVEDIDRMRLAYGRGPPAFQRALGRPVGLSL